MIGMKKLLWFVAMVLAVGTVLVSCSKRNQTGEYGEYDDKEKPVNLYTYGFDQLSESKKIEWVEIDEFDFDNGTVVKDDFKKYACYIFENGYRFYDYRSNDGVPTGKGTEPVKYIYVNNDNINLDNGDSLNIYRREVHGNIVIIKTMLYRAGRSDVERWFIPYEMIDWSVPPTREGYKITYRLIRSN